MSSERGVDRRPGDVERGLADAAPAKQGPRGGRAPRRESRPNGYRFLPRSRIGAGSILAALRRVLPASIASAFSVSRTEPSVLLLARRERAPLWYQTAEVGARQGEWLVTSAEAAMGERIRNLRPDLPDDLWTRDPEGNRIAPTIPVFDTDHWGQTIPAHDRRLSQGYGGGIPGSHGVVVVADRVTAIGGYRGPLPRRGPEAILDTFLHEIVCHAGRFSAGLPANEDHPEVRALRAEVEALFPRQISRPDAPPPPRARVPR